jgi:glycosyltransferase involved in cell wall biosynthesis
MSHRILVIASGLKDIRGHNLPYTNAVVSEMRKRGIEVTVFANKNLNEDIAKETGYKSIFSHGTYDLPPGNGATKDLIYTYLQSRIYAYELERALAESNTNFDLILCHTILDFELIGWNHFLSHRRLHGHLMIMLRVSPGFDSSPKWKLKFHPYWRIRPHYLNAIQKKMNGKFRLLTDSELLTDDYARIYHEHIITLPLPIDALIFDPIKPHSERQASVLRRYGLERNESIVFGYLGDSRGSKGFALLPGMIRQVLADHPSKNRFIVQCPASEYSQTGDPTELVELRELQTLSNEKLTLIPEKLPDLDYAELLHFLDVALLPYSHQSFQKGTSNIFAEALALGKPVIVSSNTWMAHELKKTNCGLEFQSGEINDFAAKVQEMALRCGEYQARAQKFSDEWRRLHNTRTLVDTILMEAQLN